jgi:hypothetical protein
VIDGSDIETASPHFVRQFAAELTLARRRRHVPQWRLAQTSKGRFVKHDLQRAEAGRLTLRPDTVADLAHLYGLDLTDLLPGARRGLDIRDDGVVCSGGVFQTFTPGDGASLVAAFFRLTRQLRQLDDAEPMPLRRSDLHAIAQFLEPTRPPSKYLEAVLAASLAEHRVVTGSLIAGAVSIGLAGLTDHSSPATATADGRVSGG